MPTPPNPKIVTIELGLSPNADKCDAERYEGALLAFASYLFQASLGKWDYREITLGKPKDNVALTNRFTVLEVHAEKAVGELPGK